MPYCLAQHTRTDLEDTRMIVEELPGGLPRLRVMSYGQRGLSVETVPSFDGMGDVFEWDGTRFFKPDASGNPGEGSYLAQVPDRFMPKPKQPDALTDSMRPRTKRP